MTVSMVQLKINKLESDIAYWESKCFNASNKKTAVKYLRNQLIATVAATPNPTMTERLAAIDAQFAVRGIR